MAKIKSVKANLAMIICALCGLCACKNIDRPQHANWADSTFVNDNVLLEDAHKAAKAEFCFMDVSGNQKKDTTRIHISLTKDSVSGTMEIIPFEKDRTTGSLEGQKKGDTLYVQWYNTQEGIQDTINTVFLIQNSRLKRKPFSHDEKTGKTYTAREAKFLLSYKSVPCTF